MGRIRHRVCVGVREEPGRLTKGRPFFVAHNWKTMEKFFRLSHGGTCAGIGKMGGTTLPKQKAKQTGGTNMKFGLELEFGGITYEKTAQIVADTVGGKRILVDEVEDAKGRTWKVEDELTVDCWNIGGDSCELKTPPLTEEDIPLLLQVVQNLKDAGAKVNFSCGLHVHVDGSELNRDSLVKLIAIYGQSEKQLYKAFNVHKDRIEFNAEYMSEQFFSNIYRAKDMEDIRRMWYSEYQDINHASQYHESRWKGLNLHSLWYRGTIEFRLFNGTVEPAEVEKAVRVCLALMRYAKGGDIREYIQAMRG